MHDEKVDGHRNEKGEKKGCDNQQENVPSTIRVIVCLGLLESHLIGHSNHQVWGDWSADSQNLIAPIANGEVCGGDHHSGVRNRNLPIQKFEKQGTVRNDFVRFIVSIEVCIRNANDSIFADGKLSVLGRLIHSNPGAKKRLS